MIEDELHESGGTTVRSWLVVLGLALAFLIWGLFIYRSVGDKGIPAWDFGVVQDIPGQSPYSTHQTKRLPNLSPLPETEAKGVIGQHVMEPPVKTGVVPEQGRR